MELLLISLAIAMVIVGAMLFAGTAVYDIILRSEMQGPEAYITVKISFGLIFGAFIPMIAALK